MYTRMYVCLCVYMYVNVCLCLTTEAELVCLNFVDVDESLRAVPGQYEMMPLADSLQTKSVSE